MSTLSVTYTADHKPIPKLKGVPLLGTLPQFADDPLKLMKEAAQSNHDVVELSLPVINAALVLDTDIAHQILVKEIKKFRKCPREVGIMGTVLGNGLITNNQFNSHKTHRKLAQPGFHFRRIESYGNIIADYTQNYLQDWQGESERDISDDMFKLTMYIVSKTLFDNNMDEMEGDANKIGDAIHDAQDVMNKRFASLFQVPDWIPTPNNQRIKQARATIESTIQDMIERRRLPDGSYEDRGDLLSMLLSAEYDDGSSMPMKQVMDELISLFMAGHETTSNALTWTFYLLAKHPEIQEKAQQEIDQVIGSDKPEHKHLEQLKYIEMVFKEAMRIYPPAWILTAREATEDTEINGYLFPKGKTVYVSPYANHHNPKYFADSDKFDPERFNEENEKTLPRYAFMPFGAGGRVCIGNSFAMMEGKLILASILQQFNFGLTDDLVINTNAQVTLSNHGGMNLNVTPRS